jgi:hypothetical protein
MSAILYEHEDGRYAVAASAEAATFATGDPKWHRVGPVEIVGGPLCKVDDQFLTSPRGAVRQRIAVAFAQALTDGHLWEYESFASGYEAAWLDQFPPPPVGADTEGQPTDEKGALE